jgi:ribonuclease P protein component
LAGDAKGLTPNRRFPRAARIRERWEFNRIHQEALSVHTGSFSVLALPAVSGARARLGCAIGKKVGNAVVRNRVRRMLRALFRELQGDLPAADFVVVVRPEAALHQNVASVRAELEPALRTAGNKAMRGERRRRRDGHRP